MSDIKSIVYYFTKLNDLHPENLMLAKKAALLELKFSKKNFITIENKNYSKEELIQLFEFYQDHSNIGLFESIEKLPELKFIKNPEKVEKYAIYKSEFTQREDCFKIQEYLSENYFENFFKELKISLKTKKFLKFVLLRGQISYLFYFKPSLQDKVKSYFKNYFLTEFESMRARNFLLDSNSDYKKHFLFSPYFIRFCGDIGNDDQDFLHEVLDVTHDFYNTFLKMPHLVVEAFKEHKKLNHTLENQHNLDSNIAILDTKYSSKSKWIFALKYLLYIGILLIFVFSNTNNCGGETKNRYPIIIPELKTKFKPYSYPSNTFDSLFADSNFTIPKVNIPTPIFNSDSAKKNQKWIEDDARELKKLRQKYDSLKNQLDSNSR